MIIDLYQNTMNKNSNKTSNEIIDPRLSTTEMEQNHTRCGNDFKITSMYFEDHKPHFPTLAKGYINNDQGWKINATWNQFGECTIGGLRMFSFDLINPNRKKIDEVKPMIEAIG